MRDAVAIGGNALPKREAHGAAAPDGAGQRSRHLISTGYLSLESSETPDYVTFALEAWIGDNLT